MVRNVVTYAIDCDPLDDVTLESIHDTASFDTALLLAMRKSFINIAHVMPISLSAVATLSSCPFMRKLSAFMAVMSSADDCKTLAFSFPKQIYL